MIIKIKNIRLLKCNTGGVLTVVAFVMPVIMLFIALVADIGMFHVGKAQLQTLADAASLAGATYSQSELIVDQLSRRSSPGGGLTVNVNIVLNETQARERARAIHQANSAQLMRTIRLLGEPVFYSPAIRAGTGNRVVYQVTIRGADTRWVFQSMDTPDSNVYVAEIRGEIQTILLGPLVSAVFGQPGRTALPVPVQSRSRFAH